MHFSGNLACIAEKNIFRYLQGQQFRVSARLVNYSNNLVYKVSLLKLLDTNIYCQTELGCSRPISPKRQLGTGSS